ncbi:General transcription factor II-I repeat domain-containing protein 2-like [Oopsacas minuta]|uniref:General transcription factor II-I repeat domain-containing protein 2-like n=1 Tax=Oopsacas minuta TaxID=111878 RepID=A0AAV7JHV6_9METZ|nr:General transcription factor II-I repeat domain-containing protein 2-like [Oopsacas minuta]
MKLIVDVVNFIRSKGVNHREFKEFLKDLDSDYGDVLYFTSVRWLSRGVVLKRVWELRDEISSFLASKDKKVPEFEALKSQDSADGPNMLKLFQISKKTLILNLEILEINNKASRFSQPFSFDPKYAPRELQLELVNLQSSIDLEAEFKDVGVISFYKTLPSDLSCYFKTRKKDS